MNAFVTGFLVVSGIVFWVLAAAVGILLVAAALTHKTRHAPALGPSFDDELEQLLKDGER